MQDISRITNASGLVSELDLQPLGERGAAASAMIHETNVSTSKPEKAPQNLTPTDLATGLQSTQT